MRNWLSTQSLRQVACHPCQRPHIQSMLLCNMNAICTCPAQLQLLHAVAPGQMCKCSGGLALSKSITGIESNHAAFRAAVVTFMRSSCVGRRRPWLVNAETIVGYISQTLMDTTGWMTDIELQFLASLLQITINMFATVNCKTRQAMWLPYRPAFRVEGSMAPTRDYHLYLHYNQAQY